MAPDPESGRQVSIYDEVAFPSYPYPQSHPQRLATIARLCGLTGSPLLDGCRVLELGCGAGGNLLPMAEGLPGSEFVGIDLSPQQIAIGQNQIAAIGLTNIRLEPRDILSLDGSCGKFDFLIAQGVFSWTTDAVRDKILALCRELLAPQGIAYINYNTFPGWHLQGMLRDMLYYHAQVFADPAERVREARQMIEFLFQTLPAPSTPFGGLVRAELEAIQRNSDPFLFHAYLNVVNQPVYLSEFQCRASAHGLSYLGDAEPEACWPECATPQLASLIRPLTSDTSRWSQYFDFIRFTTSRRSLLCHQNLPLERGPRMSAMQELHISAPLRRTEHAPTIESFVTSGGRTVSTREPRMQATLRLLADAWPASIPFVQLVELVEAEVATVLTRCQPIESWQNELFHGFCNRIFELSVLPSRCLKTTGECPRASALARLQAAQSDFVANQRHESVRLSEVERNCLQLLDGSRSITELSQIVGTQIRESLSRFAASGLLIAP